MSVHKVLIVDDSEVVLAVARVALERSGCQVVASKHPLGCVSLLTSEKPDLVLLDVNMPTMRGDTLARIATAANHDACVVLHSSMEPASLERLARESGADGYICKTNKTHEFVREVRRFLAIADARKQERTAPRSETLPTHGGGRSVLLVDAQLSRLSEARKAVQQLGHAPEFALSAAQAMMKLQNDPPEIILISEDLPDCEEVVQAAYGMNADYRRSLFFIVADSAPGGVNRLHHPVSVEELRRQIMKVSFAPIAVPTVQSSQGDAAEG